MKAHVTKPTTGIKMPKYPVAKVKPMAHAKEAAVHANRPNVKSTPAIRLPTIPQHREKLADLGAKPKKGKDS